MRNVKDNHAVQFGTIQTLQIKVAGLEYSIQTKTSKGRYYSQFFSTAELDSTFYDKFYSQMTKGTFSGMARSRHKGHLII